MTNLDFVYKYYCPRKAYRKSRWKKAKMRFLIRGQKSGLVRLKIKRKENVA